MRTSAIFAVLLLAAASLTAQTNVVVVAQYTGTVVDDQGHPVAGATVDCYRYPSPGGFGYWNREPKFEQTTVTDDKGTFVVSASANSTLVVFKKPGFSTAWKTRSTMIPASADPIVLTAPAALSGEVVDDSGQPVADAEVWVAGANIGNDYDRASQYNELFGGPAKSCFSTRTGADGKFRIEKFPADGRAGLAVKKAGVARHTVGSEFGGERDCQPGQDLKLVVGPAGSVEGEVIVAETGQPLGGVKITLDSGGAGIFGSDYSEPVMTGADGTFRVFDVQPGKHYVRASIPGGPVPDWVLVPENSEVTVVAGETVSNAVIHFSHGALVEVTVVVTNQLTRIADASVAGGGSTATTDMNGVALLRVPAGTNWFSARRDWLAQTKKMAILAGQTNHVQIELTPPPSITGMVHDPSGAPAGGVIVSFHPGHYPNAPDYADTTTDENGRFEIRLKITRETGAWAGSITTTNFVMARDLKRNLAAIQEFGTSPTNFNFMGIEMIPKNLDLTLQPGITLAGSVKDTEGTPLTNVWLDLSIAAGNSSSSFKPQPMKVDAQGLFNYPAMPQGRGYYFWNIKAKGYGTANGFLKPEDSKTNRYEFPAFVLKRADRQLAGRVLSRDGKPVFGATVYLSGQGQLEFRQVKTDGQGHFIFNGVCAGDVKVDARYYPTPDYQNSEQGDVAAQGGDTNVVVRLGIYVNNPGGNLSPLLKTAGTVRDAHGRPAAGVKISLFPVQGRSVETETGGDGHYEINWQTLLNQSEPKWLLARDLKSGGAALHQVEKTTTNLDLTLEDGMAISVKVSDTDGQLLTNATMSVSLRLGNMGFGVDSQPATADEHGILRVAALLRGQRYMLNIGAPGHTSSRFQQIEADETKTKSLELPPVVLLPMDRDVAGQVLDPDGKPIAGTTVQVQGTGMMSQRTTTDSDGRFAIHGVIRGTLSFTAGTPIPGSSALSNSGRVQGSSGDTNIVIRLGTNPDRVASIISAERITTTTSGTVFDPSGAPASKVFLSVLSPSSIAKPVQSDAGGKYTMQWQNILLRSNTLTVLARDLEHNWAAAAALNTNTTQLDIHLQPGITLSGSVVNSRGKPVTNAVVQLVPFPPDDLRWGMNRQAPTNVTANGSYAFTALPQGAPYSVRVSADGYWITNLRVAAADTKVEKLALPKAVLEMADQQVSGQVLGLSGKPCWGAAVSIEDENLPSKHTSHTDANGQFVISGVRKGLLTVRVTFSTGGENSRNLVCTNQIHGGDRKVVLKLQTR